MTPEEIEALRIKKFFEFCERTKTDPTNDEAFIIWSAGFTDGMIVSGAWEF